MARILIVDDEDNVRRVLRLQLKRAGYEAIEAPDGPEALDLLSQESIQTVITDLKMPKMDGLELLQQIRKQYPGIPVIMITAHGTINTAVEAMKRGAFDYITKPLNHEEFMEIIERAVRSSEELSHEFQRSHSFLKREEKIIGVTEEIENIYSIIANVANNDSNVLITGETGTGKEVVSRLLHEKSNRQQQPLIRAFVSACPPPQQESYLFGSSERPGCFELADEGTIYIDEVGALGAEAQGRLYEALTQGRYQKEDQSWQEVQCRIVAASDFNLLQKIDEGSFRKDLFYCLNVVPIYLPPLRERTQDIEPLADHFLQLFSKKFSKKVTHIDEEALHAMIEYSWPGNIRELENCLEYAVNVTQKTLIELDHLPPHIKSPNELSFSTPDSTHRDLLAEKVQKLERSAIEEALKSSGGDLLRASQKLGVPPSLLERKATSLKVAFNGNR